METSSNQFFREPRAARLNRFSIITRFHGNQSAMVMQTLFRFSVCLLAVVMFSTQRVAGVDAAPPPNIVFIMADDLGWADVAFHGGNAPTPSLDRLVKNGTELTQRDSLLDSIV